VEVVPNGLVDARVDHERGEHEDRDADRSAPFDPCTLEIVGDPDKNDEPARRDRNVLHPQEDDGLRIDEVEQRERPYDQLEVALDERIVAEDVAERIQVSLPDQRPRLVVNGEVLG
jgi:hypothetical protein